METTLDRPSDFTARSFFQNVNARGSIYRIEALGYGFTTVSAERLDFEFEVRVLSGEGNKPQLFSTGVQRISIWFDDEHSSESMTESQAALGHIMLFDSSHSSRVEVGDGILRLMSPTESRPLVRWNGRGTRPNLPVFAMIPGLLANAIYEWRFDRMVAIRRHLCATGGYDNVPTSLQQCGY